MWISKDNLATYLPDGTTLDDARASLIVDLTNQIVDDATGLTQTDLTEPADVTAMRYEVAARAYENPQGHTSATLSEGGDFTWRRDAKSRAGVYLTKAEREELRQLVTPLSADQFVWSGSTKYQ